MSVTALIVLHFFASQREKRKGEMAVLRVKNEKLEKLCRALHKGTKVTANDTEEVGTSSLPSLRGVLKV